MVHLKADPWRPDFGAGAEAPFDDDPTHVVVKVDVETSDWTRPLRPEPCPPEPVTFVDGVMRTELRVLASDGAAKTWGLLGSFAAGGVRCDGVASYVAENEPIGRALVMGPGVEETTIDIDIEGCHLHFLFHPTTDESPTGLRRKLQRLMLAEEQRLATLLAADTLVFADGPLHLESSTSSARVVGVVKRLVRAYLDGAEAALLPKLQPGDRTPLFGLGNNVLDRYAWYVRLVPQAQAWHELAGLVRCEVRMEIGPQEAIRIADMVACHLPSYAGRPGVDPRAPQNLLPIGALESRLKDRLGSQALISCALLAHLSKGDEND